MILGAIYAANETLELLRSKAPDAPMLPSWVFIQNANCYASLFDTRTEQINAIVNAEVERLATPPPPD